MEPPHYINQKYFPSLNGYRALAILAVIVGHVLPRSDWYILKAFSGTWGVDFFFVISGFLITTLLIKERERTGTISLSKFYIRRSLRIFPVAFLYIAVLYFFNAFYNLRISSTSFITAALYIKNLPIADSGDIWYLGHFWSLSVEEQYYLVVPALLSAGYVTFKRSAYALIICGCISVVLSFHVYKASVVIAFVESILVWQIPLFIGSLTSIYLCERRFTLPALGSLASITLLVGSGVLHTRLLMYIPNVLQGILSTLCFSALIVSGIQMNNSAFHRLMNGRVLAEIGILSYSLYIWQQIFTYKQFIVNIESMPNMSILCNLVLLALVSGSSYYLFERHFLRIKSKFA